MNGKPVVAYFSMEIALEPEMPTYGGGLGVLAGDMIRSAADLGVPMASVSLLYRKGYFYQRLDQDHGQSEEPAPWVVEDYLEELPERAMVTIEGRRVYIRPWRYCVEGVTGFQVAVYLLDTDLCENAEEDRNWTDSLYGGDQRHRLCQEIILGIGGMRMLEALGYHRILRFHMNEGHSALLTLELLRREAKRSGKTSIGGADVEAVKRLCTFTTHLPAHGSHDQFPIDLVSRVLGKKQQPSDPKDGEILDVLHQVLASDEELADVVGLRREGKTLNMTCLARSLSYYVNGMAKRHSETARLVFADNAIRSIASGVHGTTWASLPFQWLYDHYIPGWRQDASSLRRAFSIPADEVWAAHMEAKKGLIEYVNGETNAGMSPGVFTIGFARPTAAGDRADLLFYDPMRLKEIADRVGKIQVIHAGRAHPHHEAGKAAFTPIGQIRGALRGNVQIAHLPHYGMALERIITSGVDLWLNPPEASGASGMKAALNGVPNFSVLEGWWAEGWIEGVTGWSIGEDRRHAQARADSSKDAVSLYEKLEETIIPLFYNDNARFIDIMRHCIALNGSFFNTNRIVQQCLMSAYSSEAGGEYLQ